MANRRMQDSDYLYDSEDDPIGLTSAFPPTKGPQSVEYDKGDEAIGLTGAFAPIVIDDEEADLLDGTGKWKNFDWASYKSEEDEAEVQPADQAGQEAEGELAGEGSEVEGEPAASTAGVRSGEKGAHAGAVSTSGSSSSSGRGRHAAPDAETSPARRRRARGANC